MSGRRGLALLEVVMALVIVSVGWLALLALHSTSVRIAMESARRDEARWALQAVADSLDHTGGSAGRRDLAWGWIEWASSDGGLLLVGRDHGGDAIAETWTHGGGP